MMKNRFEQFDNWYNSEAVYNLGREEMARMFEEKDEESFINKLARIFTR